MVASEHEPLRQAISLHSPLFYKLLIDLQGALLFKLFRNIEKTVPQPLTASGYHPHG